MKDTKRRIEAFSFFDHTGIARHLTKMAGRGWLLEKISNFGWTYHRIAPKKLTFSVCYYPKASDFALQLCFGICHDGRDHIWCNPCITKWVL